MLTFLVALATIVGAMLGVPGSIVLVRQSIREGRRQREDDAARVAEERERPLRDEIQRGRDALTAMTAERNYQRDRADAYWIEISRRDKR